MRIVRMIQDPLSNSVALVQPLSRADELEIVCSFTIEHAHSNNLELPLSKSAELFPFAYSSTSASTSSTTCARTTTIPTASSPPGRASSSAPTDRPARATCWSR